MNTSKQGIDLIKQLEGFSPTAYWDVDGYSIGYGHHGAHAGQTISQAEAERLLKTDLESFEQTVRSVCPRLSQNQFDAAVSLCYNIGPTRFRKSTVAALMAADPTPRPELEQHWKEWRLAGGRVNQALVRRREKEWQLYGKMNLAPVLMGIAAAAMTVGAGMLIMN